MGSRLAPSLIPPWKRSSSEMNQVQNGVVVDTKPGYLNKGTTCSEKMEEIINRTGWQPFSSVSSHSALSNGKGQRDCIPLKGQLETSFSLFSLSFVPALSGSETTPQMGLEPSLPTETTQLISGLNETQVLHVLVQKEFSEGKVIEVIGKK